MTVSYEEVKNILTNVKDWDKVLQYIDEIEEHLSDVDGELITMTTASKTLEVNI